MDCICEEQFAPIALFVYNRPEHTKETIEALKKDPLSKVSELYIFSDAAKNEDSLLNVSKVRNYIKTVIGFKKVTIIEREFNYGLAKSIITGVSDIIDKHGKIIVLEDDLICSNQFLEFMNSSLYYYKDNKNVYSITGYSFINDTKKPIDNTYFLKITSSWSWATWKDKWQCFDANAAGWESLLIDRKKAKLFNYDNSYNYTNMIERQMKGLINSWAVRWYWSVFQNNGLTLYPRKSLVKNIGFDGSGTHCGKGDNLDFIDLKKCNLELTNDIVEKKEIRKVVAATLRKNNNHNFLIRLLGKIVRRWGKI